MQKFSTNFCPNFSFPILDAIFFLQVFLQIFLILDAKVFSSKIFLNNFLFQIFLIKILFYFSTNFSLEKISQKFFYQKIQKSH